MRAQVRRGTVARAAEGVRRGVRGDARRHELRPLTLRLKGFTSFRDEQEVDFRGLDLFAIAGPTGAGKSSLLDAITYALYGWVERVHGETSHLISQGLAQMAVELEFAIDGSRWRIARRTQRASGKVPAKTTVILERFVDGAFAPEAEGVREVEERVRDLVGLDYDGFTRAVLLPQGKFDQFLTGKPEDRRKILTDLLDLNLYRRMQNHAQKIASDSQKRVEYIRESLTKDFADATEDALRTDRARASELRAREKRLAEARRVVRAIVERRNAARRAVDDLRACAGEARAHGATATTVAAALARVDRELAVADRDQTRAARRATDATKAATAARDKLAAARQRSGTEKELRDLERAAERFVEARGELARSEDRIAEAEEALPTLRERVTARAAALKAARAVEARDKSAVQDARRAVTSAQHDDALAAVARGLKKGDPCPVCRKPLAAAPKAPPAAALERAEAALARAESSYEAARERARAADEAVRDAARAVATTAEQLAAAKRDAAERKRVVTAAQGALRETLGAKLPADPIGAIRQRLDELAALDATAREADAEASSAREAAARAEASRTKLAVKMETERARLPLAAASSLVTRAARLARPATLPAFAPEVPAGPDAAAWSAFATTLSRALVEQGDAIERIASQRSGDDRTFLDEASRAAGDLVPAQRTLDALDEAIDGATRECVGEARAAEERARRIEKDLARRAELEREAVAGEKRGQVMAALARDLMANAIVDFVQDEALRTLAREGTRRLAYLSGERYRLRFRDNEFYVVDVWNGGEERSVRTLSGGETFLASLALALTLSEQIRTLATTDRARLDSLFLDEGFGTLDPDTLAQVTGGIERLGVDGRLVGVISHVRELTDQFPRIEVEKSPRGSTARLVAR